MATVEKIRRIPGENGSSLLHQVVARFAANAGALMADLRAKARNSDPEAVWRAAHGLRSSAASIGACRVAQCCREIEVSARDKRIIPSDAALAALENELNAATRALDGLVQEPEPSGGGISSRVSA
jgi:HPt (histidine-containing phosphotransfer) domain-containing protein